MKKIFLTLFLSQLILACGALNPLDKKQISLTNTQWVLQETVQGKTPTLIIETNRIAGTGGCNNYFSEVVINAQKGSFVVGNIASTKMACNHLQVEQNYFDLLQQTNQYSLKNDVLELYKDHLLLMRFKKLQK